MPASTQRHCSQISANWRETERTPRADMALGQKASLLLLFIAALVALGIYHALGAGKARTVGHVFDGDTIALEDGTRVRLIGVDAPEVDSPYSKLEPFGEDSKAFLTSLVLNRKVFLDEGDPARDKYGRTLAYVYVDDVLVNGRMIRAGWARAYRQFHHPWRDLFIAYEREARSKGLGMWRENNRRNRVEHQCPVEARE